MFALVCFRCLRTTSFRCTSRLKSRHDTEVKSLFQPLRLSVRSAGEQHERTSPIIITTTNMKGETEKTSLPPKLAVRGGCCGVEYFTVRDIKVFKNVRLTVWWCLFFIFGSTFIPHPAKRDAAQIPEQLRLPADLNRCLFPLNRTCCPQKHPSLQKTDSEHHF